MNTDFDASYKLLLSRGEALKKEYDRTYADPKTDSELKKILDQYSDPEYVRGIRVAISASAQDCNYEHAFQILPLVATMFMTMASSAFASDSGFSSFSKWANAFPQSQKRELVRFAYIATVWEQEQSGPKNPVSFATRVLLMALAANANDDAISKETAKYLFSHIDQQG